MRRHWTLLASALTGGAMVAALAACGSVGEDGSTHAAAEEPVSTMRFTPDNLPHSNGKTFERLDDYLKHLETQGTMDKPFYREVEPGIYERVVGRSAPGHVPERLTRKALLERYGFEG